MLKTLSTNLTKPKKGLVGVDGDNRVEYDGNKIVDNEVDDEVDNEVDDEIGKKS